MATKTSNALRTISIAGLLGCIVVALLLFTPSQSSGSSAQAVLVQRYQSVWQYGRFSLRQDYSPDFTGDIQIPPQETFVYTTTNGFIGTSPITSTLTSVRLFKGAPWSAEYTDNALLRLVVGPLGGTGLRTVSAHDVNLSTIPIGTWTEIALSGDIANLVLRPDEYLAFQAVRNGEGYILVPAVIQAVVESDAKFVNETYLPALQR
ncbi:MAG: hypothetical protein U0X20_00465 [Caldilineaceae bacterium]